MGKKILLSLLAVFFVFATAASSFAGGRHFRGPHFAPNHLWAKVGLGIATGIAVGAMVHKSKAERESVYRPPRVHQPPPVVVYRQSNVPVYRHTEIVVKRVQTTATLLNVRSQPGYGSPVKQQVPEGTVLNVIGMTPDWLRVQTMDGQYGWISEQYAIDLDAPVG